MKEIAIEIIRQLGGNKFLSMTGSQVQGVYRDKRGRVKLSFKLKKNKSKANILDVAYDGISDNYVLYFLKLSNFKIEVKKTYKDVMCDQLQPIFKEITGFDTHL